MQFASFDVLHDLNTSVFLYVFSFPFASFASFASSLHLATQIASAASAPSRGGPCRVFGRKNISSHFTFLGSGSIVMS